MFVGAAKLLSGAAGLVVTATVPAKTGVAKDSSDAAAKSMRFISELPQTGGETALPKNLTRVNDSSIP